MLSIVSFLVKVMAVGVVKMSMNPKVPAKGQKTLIMGMINYSSNIEQLLLSCLFLPPPHISREASVRYIYIIYL